MQSYITEVVHGIILTYLLMIKILLKADLLGDWFKMAALDCWN